MFSDLKETLKALKTKIFKGSEKHGINGEPGGGHKMMSVFKLIINAVLWILTLIHHESIMESEIKIESIIFNEKEVED